MNIGKLGVTLLVVVFSFWDVVGSNYSRLIKTLDPKRDCMYQNLIKDKENKELSVQELEIIFNKKNIENKKYNTLELKNFLNKKNKYECTQQLKTCLDKKDINNKEKNIQELKRLFNKKNKENNIREFKLKTSVIGFLLGEKIPNIIKDGVDAYPVSFYNLGTNENFDRYQKIVQSKNIIGEENEEDDDFMNLNDKIIGDLTQEVINFSLRDFESIYRNYYCFGKADSRLDFIKKYAHLHAYKKFINILEKPEIIKFLIENGADPNQVDQFGKTLLHYACSNDCRDMALFLIKNGANVDKEDAWGKSPLYYAYINDHTILAKLLVDSNAKDLTGEKTIELNLY